MENFLLNENYNGKLRVKSASNNYLILKNGKKLLDTTFCSGTLLLGHANKIINKQIKKKIDLGLAYAIPNIHTDKYSIILKKIFKNYSKFLMCGSGSDAIIKSIRIARAITNKEYIVMAKGSWHGSVDQTLFDHDDKKKRTLSKGLTKDTIKKIILVPYNDFEKTKKIINKYKSKIALVLLEPIQQEIPSIYNETYIKKTYDLCKKINILIGFDEMITGMRVNKFSVHQKLNIKPDLCTVGKIIGGGLPIGVIGLTKNIEKKLQIKNNKVFFGGTFSGNPLVAQTGYKTLDYIYKNKKKIYFRLEKLSKHFETKMNLFYNDNNIEMKIIRYDSIIKIIYTKKKIKNKKEKKIIEDKFQEKIKNLRKFTFDNGVFLTLKGAIFFPYTYSLKDLNFLIKILQNGSIKYFS